jgi:Tfp pilus assembly protein PilE
MNALGKSIIIGAAALVLLAILAVCAIFIAAYYGWHEAQRAGDEAATVQDLKTIAVVEIQYFNTHNRTFGTIDQLISENMLTSKFAGKPTAADGYLFNLKVMPKASGQISSYALNADPQSDTKGSRHFYIDSTSETIHANPDHSANASDPPLGK